LGGHGKADKRARRNRGGAEKQVSAQDHGVSSGWGFS
jgi:hypothetical protein